MGLKENYDKLFASMASSTDISKMKTFGKVSNDVMYWLINNYPDLAKGFIDRLQSVGWHNYLSEDEAMTIVENMEPKPDYSFDAFKKFLADNSYQSENEPYYNEYALYVTMCMIMSDSKQTIEKYVNGSDIYKLVYDLAIDKLTDKDKMFSIRSYFKL